MTNNEQVTKLKEHYKKTGKSPFLFNIKTGEVESVNSFSPYQVVVDIGNRVIKTHIRCGGDWRFITDEYYPMYEGEAYVFWYPYGVEDTVFEQEMEKMVIR